MLDLKVAECEKDRLEEHLGGYEQVHQSGHGVLHWLLSCYTRTGSDAEIGICPVCTSMCTKAFYCNHRNMRYLLCINCQSLFLDPKPTDSELQSFYDNHYYDNCNPGIGLQAKRDTYTFLADRIVSKHAGGNVLEIGAGTGFFMDLLNERGLKVYGTEFSDAAWKLNPYAKNGTLTREIQMLPSGLRFQAIVLLDVIEHMPDPRAFLGELLLHLAPDAQLYMVTPDRTSLSGRIMRTHWPHISAPEHITLFSRRGLRSLAEQLGYKWIEGGPWYKRISLYYAKEILERYSKLKIDVFFLRFLCSILPKPVAIHTWNVPTGQMLAVIQVGHKVKV